MRDQNALRADEVQDLRSSALGEAPVKRKAVVNALKKPSTSKPKLNVSMLLRKWHQRIGLFAFIFMGWLGFSGVLLNQSVSMGLDAIRVNSIVLMSMYGLHAEVPESGFRSGDHWLVTTTENTVLDDIALEQHIASPLGFVDVNNSLGEILYVATSDKLTLLSPEGAVIEEQSGYMLPVGHIRSLGLLERDGRSYLALQGENTYITEDGLTWNELDSPDQVTWSALANLSDEAKTDVEPFSHPTVALEQVLIDLHSGRLFGAMGTTLINFVGVAAVLLSITGVWMTWRTNRMRSARSKK
jgi:hypothetical protein